MGSNHKLVMLHLMNINIDVMDGCLISQSHYPAFIFWIEVKLWAMERLHVGLLGDQPQPDVIKPEHLDRNFKKL